LPENINLTVTDRFARQCAGSGSKWEPKMGYSRAVRSGNWIAVSGTVGVGADGKYSASIEDQTRRSLAIIRAAI
jgi:enamine deaminase RidA (YjgF/YER057c/UK114 family)